MLQRIKNTLKKTPVYDIYRGYKNKQEQSLDFKKQKIVNHLKAFDLRPESRNQYRETPKLSQIEITNICNLNCVMCQTKEQQRDLGMMNVDVFEKIADEIASMGIDRVGLHTIGETFVHKDLQTFVKLLLERNLKPCIVTNAMYPQKMEYLLEKFPEIKSFQISLESARPELYEKIRRGAKHKTLVRSFEMVNELNKRRPPEEHVDVTIKALICEDNMYELKDILDLKKNFDCISEVKFNLMDLNNATKNQSDVKPGVLGLDTLMHGYADCRMTFNRVNFTWDGKVTLCCRDYEGEILAGDMKNQTLKEVWHGEEAQKIRSMFIKPETMTMEGCKSCFSFHTPALESIVNYLYWLYEAKPELTNEELGKQLESFIFDLNNLAERGEVKNLYPQMAHYFS